MFNYLFFTLLIIFSIYFLLKLWNNKNMEIIQLDENDIKNQIESGLSQEDKYLGEIAQVYPLVEEI